MNTAANDTASSAPAWLPAGPALLFAPADRPDRFAKAAERSDVVIVDLEDGAGDVDRACDVAFDMYRTSEDWEGRIWDELMQIALR